MQKLLKIIIYITILLSFITYVVDQSSINLFFSRLTMSTLFGLISLLIFSIIYAQFLIDNRKKIGLFFYAPILLVLSFLISSSFSLDGTSSFNEILIVIFLVLYAIVLVLIFKNRLLKELIPVIIITAFITSFIGIYDLVAKNLGWFTIFSTPDNYAKSGFRYFGQAGSYIFTFLIVLIPLKYSTLFKQLAPIIKRMFYPTILLSISFLIATGKIAAIIGFGIGVFFFVIRYRKEVYKDVLLSLVLFLGFFFIAKVITPKVIERLVYRVESRITSRVTGTPEADFVISNFDNSIKAFKENPLTGAGLGAYQGVYADTEIHGTYLKMLGETGLIGLLGYLVFMGSIAYMLFKATKVKHNKYADFLVKLIPFFIGFLVCQAYCYHIRKLEFWILYAVIIIAYLNMNTTIKLPNLSETKTH